MTIDGRDYTIIGSQPLQHIEAVVDIVNSQLNQLKSLDPRLSVADRSLLMAVNAVSDQVQKEKKIMDLEAQLLEVNANKGDKTPKVPFSRN